MARVCKLLGDDVPVDLVFPTHDDPEVDYEKYDFVLDICAPRQKVETPPPYSPPATPPKYKIQRKPVPSLPNTEQHQQQPRWLAYRNPNLETIVEQSPRTSYSSSCTSSSADSACSLLTNTTSSSYRFTSSGCGTSTFESSTASFAAAAAAHESISSTHLASSDRINSANAPLMDEQIREMSGTFGRREFAMYVPFRRRTNRSLSCQAELGKECNGQFEVVRGMLDLRI